MMNRYVRSSTIYAAWTICFYDSKIIRWVHRLLSARVSFIPCNAVICKGLVDSYWFLSIYLSCHPRLLGLGFWNPASFLRYIALNILVWKLIIAKQFFLSYAVVFTFLPTVEV